MTDKEKLKTIRAEIERLKNELIANNENTMFEQGCISAFEDALLFINSLPEEPVKINRQVSKMADEFAEREYETDGYERQWLSKGYYHGFMDAKGKLKEPASENLEEASKEWLSPQLDKSYSAYGETKMMELTHFDGYAMLDAIEFGAQWQKQQDQSTIELAEDHAMLAGMEKMKEEMMANAIDVEVKVDAGGYPYIDKTIELYDYDKDVPLAKEGDIVSVIVI